MRTGYAKIDWFEDDESNSNETTAQEVRSLGRTYGFRTIISFINCLNRLELIMQPYFGWFPVSFFQLTTGTNEHKNRNKLAHCTWLWDP